jgi:predicted permease
MGASFIITHIETRLIPYDTAEHGVITNSVLFYNCGNMGLPIIYLIFGNTAHLNHEVTVQLAVILMQSLAVQSFGLFISKNSGSGGSALKAIVLTLRMPQPLDSYSKQSRSISRISFSGLHWNISTRWSWALHSRGSAYNWERPVGLLI